MEIKSRIIFVLVMTIPNILTTKRINGSISKEYIILILNYLSFTHKLSLVIKSLRMKEETPDLWNVSENCLHTMEISKIKE